MTIQPPPRMRGMTQHHTLPPLFSDDDYSDMAREQYSPYEKVGSFSVPGDVQDDDNEGEDKETKIISPLSSLARLAYASGTGEDVTAFTEKKSRFRWKIEGKTLYVIVLILALMLAGTWGYAAFERLHEVSAQNMIDHDGGDGDVLVEDSDKEVSEDVTVDSGENVVYISGAVVNPGVYTVENGKRLNDVVALAGGLTPQAEHSRINLAALVQDGEHVHIPVQGEEVANTSVDVYGNSDVGNGKININTANANDLEQLPGIGPALAQSIIQWRSDNGKFTSIEDLLEVSGIGNAKYAKLKDHVTF